MTPLPSRSPAWLAPLILIWIAGVLVAYYLFNAGYYAEKLGTFGRYFLKALG